MIKKKNKFYVYMLIVPTEIVLTDVVYVPGDVFYVGKGCGSRAKRNSRPSKHLKNQRRNGKKIYNELKESVLHKILENNQDVIIKYEKKDISEKEAFRLEGKLITKLGRIIDKNGKLTNLTLGGEGVSGMRFSKATREKMSKDRKGKPSGTKGIKRPGAGGRKKGTKWSEKERQANMAARATPEAQENIKNGRLSAGHKISIKGKGRPAPHIKGTIWVNNGVKEKYVKPDQIPEGYILGRKPTSNSHQKGKHWYTNGVENKNCFEKDCPKGWNRGRITYKKNATGIQILTDSGWSDFSGLIKHKRKQVLVIKTEKNEIKTTPDHCFYLKDYSKCEAQFLRNGVEIHADTGLEKVIDVLVGNKEIVYDLHNVELNNRFYANGVLVKNCKFLSFDETLINATTLSKLKGIEPSFIQGMVRWYSKPIPNRTYLISLDPSMGTGGDSAAIQVFQLPEMMQVAEWQHNKTDVPTQIKYLREIATYIKEEQSAGNNNRDSEIYWTLENNSIGEAANIVINEIGEENIPGTFLSQQGMIRGAKRRKGFFMSNKLKIEACNRFKNLIEKDKIHIKSKALVSQLKIFVARGASYAAKGSEHDDLVMACLLIVKMLERVMNFDDLIKEQFQETIEDTESRPPLWGLHNSGMVTLF